MEVILTQEVDNLGEKNEIVKVKNGYGRNFLIPKGMAKIANDANRKMLAEELKQQSHKLAAILEEAKGKAAKVEGASINIATKVGKEDKIFGSVTNLQLSEALKSATGLDVDRKKFTLPKDIKTTGTYEGSVRLHREVIVNFEFNVVAE